MVVMASLALSWVAGSVLLALLLGGVLTARRRDHQVGPVTTAPVTTAPGAGDAAGSQRLPSPRLLDQSPFGRGAGSAICGAELPQRW